MTNLDLGQRVHGYLRTCHVATLATMGADGPWAAAVFYVSDGYTLYFLSSPRSRHCRNLEQDSRVAVTVQADYSEWHEIKGVQLEGEATLLAGADEKRARQLFALKFPLIERAPAAIASALSRVRWYSIVPARLFFIDNSIGFGHRDEIIPTRAGA